MECGALNLGCADAQCRRGRVGRVGKGKRGRGNDRAEGGVLSGREAHEVLLFYALTCDHG
jgi:hypothetical protein